MNKILKSYYETNGLNSIETKLTKENGRLCLEIICTQLNTTQSYTKYKLDYKPNWKNKEFLYALNKLTKNN